MSLVASDKGGGGGGFAVCPAGSFAARCVQIIDLGTQQETFQGRTKWMRKLLLGFEMPTEIRAANEYYPEGPWMKWKGFTLSLSEGAHLRKTLVAWRGREFSEEELKAFDLRKVVGAPALITIVHGISKKSGNKYAAIDTIVKLPRELEIPDQISESLFFDTQEWDEETFQKLGKRSVDQIMESREYRERAGEQVSDDRQVDTQEPAEEDIPF